MTHVLCVGGPLHGELREVNHPHEFEHITHDMLLPYGQRPKWPEERRANYSQHKYLRDPQLSRITGRPVFLHESFLAEPANGGFLASSLDACLKKLGEADEALKRSDTTMREKNRELIDLRREKEELIDRAENATTFLAAALTATKPERVNRLVACALDELESETED